jgi:hypothetical protein
MKSILWIACVLPISALVLGCGADHFASDAVDAGAGDASAPSDAAASDAAACDFKWTPKNESTVKACGGAGQACGIIFVRRSCCSVVAIGVGAAFQQSLQKVADAVNAGCGCTPSSCSAAGATLVDEFGKPTTCSPMQPAGCIQAQCDNGSCGAHVN